MLGMWLLQKELLSSIGMTNFTSWVSSTATLICLIVIIILFDLNKITTDNILSSRFGSILFALIECGVFMICLSIAIHIISKRLRR